MSISLPSGKAFLVNFVTLLVTPVGATGPYDGIADMVGMVVDEAYKSLADDGNPNIYTGINEELGLIEQVVLWQMIAPPGGK